MIRDFARLAGGPYFLYISKVQNSQQSIYSTFIHPYSVKKATRVVYQGDYIDQPIID